MLNRNKAGYGKGRETTEQVFTLPTEDVDEFPGLVATVCKEGGGMKDHKNRLSKAGDTFIRLKWTWSPNNISRRTKLLLYKMLVVTFLLKWV